MTGSGDDARGAVGSTDEGAHRDQSEVAPASDGGAEYVRETVSEKQIHARAAAVSRKYAGQLLPHSIFAMTTSLANVYLVPEMFISSLMLPMVLSFCNGISFSAWMAKPTSSAQGATGRRDRFLARPKGWNEKPNMTLALLSTSGANKSAPLADLQATVSDVCRYRDMTDFVATDYTVEAIQALMGDTNGTALLLLDEMKKIKSPDEYKKNTGTGNEKLMELQSGQKFRVIRKGGASSSGAAPGTPAAPSAVTSIEAQAHLNISGTTHVHTGHAWYEGEAGQTDGKMTRFDCVVVEALYEDLPDRADMEKLGSEIYDGLDIFLVLNVVATLCNIFVKDIGGFVLLDDDAYKAFQDVIKSEINPELKSLAADPKAGAQVSSLSKLKGKILKFAGAIFLLVIAAQLCEDDAVKDFEFELDDKEQHEEFEEVLRETDLVQQLLEKDRGGKIITFESLTFGIRWAKMFHETAMALQRCMVLKSRLPRQSAAEPQGDADGAESETSEIVSNAGSESVRRHGHASFEDPIYWAAHCILMAKKFEARIVSGSYMTVESARLAKGDNTTATAGRPLSTARRGSPPVPRPTFHAAAMQLIDDGLAKPIWESTGKLKVGMPPKLWGVELVNLSRHDPDVAFQVLAPYQVDLETAINASMPMPTSERNTFKQTELQKFMRMPPPQMPAIPLEPAPPGSPASALAQGQGATDVEHTEGELEAMAEELSANATGDHSSPMSSPEPSSQTRDSGARATRSSERVRGKRSADQQDQPQDKTSDDFLDDFAPAPAPSVRARFRNIFNSRG